LSCDDELRDFELHRALEDVAPAAVRTLVDLATKAGLSGAMRDEAIARLRQMEAAGLTEGLPQDLRDRVDRILRNPA
jgi:hypothetical protein